MSRRSSSESSGKDRLCGSCTAVRRLLVTVTILFVVVVGSIGFFTWQSVDDASGLVGAAALGDMEALRFYVEKKGVDPNTTLFGPEPPLISAARHGQSEAIEYCIHCSPIY